MLSLIDGISAAHHRFVAEQVAQEEDPGRRLERFFRAGLEWIAHNLTRGKVMLTMLNGPDAEFRERMWQGYQPMHHLLAGEVLLPGMEQGLFWREDPLKAAGLLMVLYLGIGSAVDEQGQSWLPPEWISGFVLKGLLERGG